MDTPQQFSYIAPMKWKLTFWLLILAIPTMAQPYTRQDTLRGSNGRGRDWWDVLRYESLIYIWPDTTNIFGTVNINFKIVGLPKDSLQIDLQDTLLIDRISFNRKTRKGASKTVDIQDFVKDGNVWWIKYPFKKEIDSTLYYDYNLEIAYHGKPRIATNPPWNGGVIRTKDSTGKPWLAVACQGLGASSWWPCKDYQGDEPDQTVVAFQTIDSLKTISNGKSYIGIIDPNTGEVTSESINRWITESPINTYSTTFYIGDYAHYHDTLHGEGGILDLDFYPLKYNEAKARKHWAVTKEMLRCFEYWMGPYPFYEDGYKLVEAPYLGMEHQSAIAYGNKYKMGYLGHDRSGSKSGVGLAFDFIIIHESGHEWFGNSITAQDIADNWLHEGFTTYTETLFAEWIKGRDEAFEYATGEWKNIKNDRPVIGDYGVNKEGSNDMYDKGAAVVHMIRMMLHDDQKFRQLLHGLNKDFYHKNVTSEEVEDYISRFVGKDLKPFFDVYLRRTKIPILQYERSGETKLNKPKHKLRIRLIDVPKDFVLPVYSREGKFLFNLSAEMQTLTEEHAFQTADYLLVRMEVPNF